MARRRAFTMVELMIVIGIIMLLVTLLVPVIKSILSKSQRTECSSNLNEIGMRLNAYTISTGGVYPRPYIPRTTPFGAILYAMQYDVGAAGQHGMSAGATSPAVYKALMGTGMGELSRIVQCPSRPVCYINPTTDPSRGEAVPANWGNMVLTSYIWTYGLNPVPSSVGTPTTLTRSPMRNNTNYVLAADLAENTGTADTGTSPARYNHSDGGVFAGSNTLYVGGNVKWIPSAAGVAATAADILPATKTNFVGGASGTGRYYDGQSRTWFWALDSVP
ncbi:MAG: type II secretion system GspH family protein [Planctomycetaceae bacterium]|nr:type II secretion system GspH family protein [Planctomycetaceae bacterium]